MFQFTILRRYEYVYRNNCYNTLYDSICTVMVQQHLLLLYSIVCIQGFVLCTSVFFFLFSFLPKNYFVFCRGGALLNLVFTLISIITGHFWNILKGLSNEIFDLQFFLLFEPNWATDHWVNTFSILFKNLPSLIEFFNLPGVSYPGESIKYKPKHHSQGYDTPASQSPCVSYPGESVFLT